MAYRLDDSDFRKISRDMKQLDAGLYKEFRGALRTKMKPLQRDLRDSAKRKLPGNLGAEASREIGLSVTQSGAYIAWRPRRGSFTQRNALDQGVIRHPLYGNRSHWFTTEYPKAKGWWTEPADKGMNQAIDDINNVITDYLRRFAALG